MIRRTVVFAFVAAIFLPVAANAQPSVVKDPAELFPPDSLLFVELTKPADLSNEVAAFLKGSVVDDMPAFMAKWREKKGDGYFMASEIVAMLSAFAGPEALNEYKRMQGAAFAITGINTKNEPEYAFVLLAGQSNVPNFIMRIYMTADPSIRSAGKVEGVTLYWEKSRMFRAVGPGGVVPPAPQPPEKPSGPIFAMPPGAIVVGSSVDTVTDVIKRMNGQEKRLSLLGAPGFRDSASLRRRPGIFAFTNPGRSLEVIEGLFKGKDNDYPPIARRAVAELLNPKGMRYAAASLSLVEGSIDLQIDVKNESGKSSPILELIGDQHVSLAEMKAAPKDSIGLFTIALKDGDKQYQKFLALADTIVGNDGPKPSEQVKGIEQQIKASIGKDILGRIASITVAMPAKQELPKGAMEAPMLIVNAKNAAAAEQLEKLAPSLLGLASGEPIEPVTETIHGQKVRSVPGRAFPWKAALHYGRGGSSLIFGLDRKLVAAAMAGAAKDSILSEARLAETLKAHEQSAFVGMYRWGNLLPDWFAELGQERRWVNGKMVGPDQAKIREKADKLRKTMEPLIREMPPLIVSMTRQNDALVVRVRQHQKAGASAKIIDGVLDAVMSSATNLFDQIGAAAAPAAPPAPPIKN